MFGDKKDKEGKKSSGRKDKPKSRKMKPSKGTSASSRKVSEKESSSTVRRVRSGEVTFLPCPGLSTKALKASLSTDADFWEKKGQRPKQNVKFSFVEKQQFDYVREIMAKNVWYYKDRLMVSRGPCNLHVLRTCWVNGVIDENTLVWGQGLMDWLPVRNVRTLIPQIRTLEVQAATWIKRTFGLLPALRRLRKQRGNERSGYRTSQVDRMF